MFLGGFRAKSDFFSIIKINVNGLSITSVTFLKN